MGFGIKTDSLQGGPKRTVLWSQFIHRIAVSFDRVPVGDIIRATTECAEEAPLGWWSRKEQALTGRVWNSGQPSGAFCDSGGAHAAANNGPAGEGK